MTTVYTFREAGAVLGVSRQAIYSLVNNHLQELDGLVRINQGRKTITTEGLEVLKKLARCKVDCKENCKASDNLDCDMTGNQETLEWYRQALVKKDELIKTLIDNQAEEKRRADTIILTLTRQVESYRLSWESYGKEAGTADQVITPEQDHAASQDQEPIREATARPEEKAPDGWTDFHLDPLPEEPKQAGQGDKIAGFVRILYELFNPVALRGRV